MNSVTRLLDTFVPATYDLSLVFERTERRFHGTVSINGTAPKATDALLLHSRELAVTSAHVDGKEVAVQMGENDELSLLTPDLSAGSHVLTLQFSGEITDGMHGIYPCYFEHDGQKKELIATQFESHAAREAFPCIDEPSAKAKFNVTLTTEQGVTVLGNMPVKDQREEDGLLVTQFEETPIMSTYLVAWVIGELHKKSTTTKTGVEVNVWATPAQSSDSFDFALDHATKTIEFFDDYFETPYPLPKSDHVALPDFSAAAMENWGLITYREVALLVDPKTTSLANKHQAAEVISHEISHQWFGNLVTMAWWDDLWLNESFANIMAYVAVDALQPSWETWLEHATSEVPHALRRDSIDGVQAIKMEVHHPDEIGSIFDPSIVYAKGGRLVRMLEHYIGTEAFTDGLRAYFKKFAYKNTTADDLWQCMSESSGQDIGTLMHAWINKSGYPVVHVSTNAEEDSINLTQEQFFIGDHSPSDKLWPIPLNATNPNWPQLLTEKQVTFKNESQDITILNHGGTAHFITHYEPSLLQKILGKVESLDAIDRQQLLQEQTLLAQGQIITSADMIPLLAHYKTETSDAVWYSIAIVINELKRFVEDDSESEQRLRRFVGEIAANEYERLGWDPKAGEPENDIKLRSLILSMMFYSERPDIIKKAQTLYDATSIDKLDPELRSGIMATAVRYAHRSSIVDDLLSFHQKTASNELQEDIAAALTATKDPAVIDRLIGLFKDEQIIRPQDFPRWFVWLMRNRYGREKTWRWARDNWDFLLERYEGDGNFDAIPRYIASCLITAKQLEEYTEFFTPMLDMPALKRNITLGISDLKAKIALTERDGPAVREALLKLDK